MDKNVFNATITVIVKNKETSFVVEGPFNVNHHVHPEPYFCDNHRTRELRIRQLVEMHMLYHLIRIMQAPKYGDINWAYEIVEFSYK